MTAYILMWLQDPMNFGAVLRSSYYFGVQKVFTTRTDRWVHFLATLLLERCKEASWHLCSLFRPGAI